MTYVRKNNGQMRYSNEHKERRRAEIVDAAARLFQTRGINVTGVDAVMEAVGLTAGGFYNHFRSKHALVAEAVATRVRANRERLSASIGGKEGRAWMAGFVRRYLSSRHRDAPDEGCPFAALSTELARVEESRPVVERELEQYVQLLTKNLESDQGLSARQRAFALFAMLVGSIALARALKGTELSDELLRASRAAALRWIEA